MVDIQSQRSSLTYSTKKEMVLADMVSCHYFVKDDWLMMKMSSCE